MYKGSFAAQSTTFELIPFSREENGQLAVAGIISRNGSCFTLSYQLSGDIGSLLFPDRVDEPGRRDELWRTTCCECFIRVAGTSKYFELNISPNGNWNVYRFTDYREGMGTAESVTEVECQTSRESEVFILHCAVQLDGLVERGDKVEIGVSCVLKHNNGTTSYWALSHPGPKPDFHNPQTFTLKL